MCVLCARAQVDVCVCVLVFVCLYKTGPMFEDEGKCYAGCVGESVCARAPV